MNMLLLIAASLSALTVVIATASVLIARRKRR